MVIFSEIEKIIDAHSPPSERKYMRWRDNTQGTVAICAILNGSFQVVVVDMENEKERFRRIQGVQEGRSPSF
jgi:hypothetical protein